ncbi:hypothetical protein K402DRAFT_54403 [Aulographum hederae CBS 113979]|uniref:Uncharacterized protein n=1 Tax=Aulographum hederae CBS 113979 TaxID=1176131 RepID=A0A6G1H2E4_9PEZI|nr:hypothetical protein K402DRAFT_54403 [Aulographum hederae CBS 113979]
MKAVRCQLLVFLPAVLVAYTAPPPPPGIPSTRLSLVYATQPTIHDLVTTTPPLPPPWSPRRGAPLKHFATLTDAQRNCSAQPRSPSLGQQRCLIGKDAKWVSPRRRRAPRSQRGTVQRSSDRRDQREAIPSFSALSSVVQPISIDGPWHVLLEAL